MGTYLDRNQFQACIHNCFVFDLEYIGPTTDLNDCHIWDMAFIHLLTGASYERSITPDLEKLPPPFSQEFISVTDSLLKERQAVSFRDAWADLEKFIVNNSVPNMPVIFIAHNSFKSDKKMIEVDCHRHGISLSYHWCFFDSLIYSRKQLPKRTSYTLNDLYNTFFCKDIDNQHFALSDAIALRLILYELHLENLEGSIYPSYFTSLQAIKWLGPSCERILFMFSITSVEQLINVLTSGYSKNFNPHVNLQIYIENYLVEKFQIKRGNAVSISNSLVSKWIKGL